MSTTKIYCEALKAIEDKNYCEADKLLQECINRNYSLVSRKASILLYEEFKKIVSTLSNDEIEWLKELSKNNSYAQCNLGYMYHYGLGVEKNYEEAVRLYRLSADQGNALGQNNLGYMYRHGFIYRHGLGVEKDLNEEDLNEEAVRLYRLSAEQGNLFALNNLGWMYEDGLGVEKDYKEAIRLYRLSADKDYFLAKNNLNKLINYLKSL